MTEESLTLKEHLINLKEQLIAFQKKLSDVLNENVFVSGYDNLFNEGMIAYEKGKYKRAISYFEKAHKENPKNFNGVYNLALSFQAYNKFDEAIKYYKTALNIINNDYDTIYNLGLCYLNTFNGELAEQYLKQATELEPKDDSAKMSYILALVECNKIDEAIEKTIEFIKTDMTQIDFTLSVTKFIESKTLGINDVETITKAIKLLNSYIKLCDSSDEAHIQTSLCYAKLGNWDLALKHALKAYQLNPKSYEINRHTGVVLYCNQNYDEALKYYEQALSLHHKKNFDIHYNIALTYEKLSMRTELETKLKYIIKTFKNNPQVNEAKQLLKIHFNIDC